MVKQQDGKLVMRRMTKGQVESFGADRYYRQTWQRMLVYCLGGFAGMLVGLFLSNFVTGVFMLVIIGIFTWWVFKGMVEGKRFWKVIKDKEEPVNL